VTATSSAAAIKRTCSSCGDLFIGRQRAQYCSPACRKRAQRARGSNKRDKCDTEPVTVMPVRTAGHSSEAEAVLRALDDQLALVGQERGETLEWTPQERFALDLLSAEIDRTVDLAAVYESCGEDVKLRVKLSAELRLLRQSTARMVREIKTELPARPSHTTTKARKAANARWHRGGGDDAAG
jgi:hypothetical protein